MQKIMAFLLGVGFLAGNTLLASELSEQPRGNLLELHSCELYAGGCIVSSEVTLGGRYMVRAWHFTGGQFAGTELAGLGIALMQSSPENLAMPNSAPGQCVVYLPDSATGAQQSALVSYIKSLQPELKNSALQTRVVPLTFARTDDGYSFSAGDFVKVQTISMEKCAMGGCGEALWYTPRSSTALFTVEVDKGSSVNEPLLKVRWEDSGKRSVFLGRFGEGPTREVYVTSADLCGFAGKLF